MEQVNSENLKADNLSVIIRNRNEARWIGHAIQSIIDLVVKPEIVVIDNNSKDDSLSIVRNFMQDPILDSNNSRNYTNIKIVNINDYTPGKSINLGVQNSSRDYILILSAHCAKKFNLEQLQKDKKLFWNIWKSNSYMEWKK